MFLVEVRESDGPWNRMTYQLRTIYRHILAGQYANLLETRDWKSTAFILKETISDRKTFFILENQRSVGKFLSLKTTALSNTGEGIRKGNLKHKYNCT